MEQSNRYDHEERYKDSADVLAHEAEIAEIDAQIMRLWQRRNELARLVAAIRRKSGRPANPYSEELSDRSRFVHRAQELGVSRALGGEVIDLLTKAAHKPLPPTNPETQAGQ
ncbi:MAG TPA: chorismate mutase [Candidatus Saccharimonadales bacterium]|nr:chorismate mutase [Candidatus Saccharimonadales bacterium]